MTLAGGPALKRPTFVLLVAYLDMNSYVEYG
jgi:hypothetical protein